MNKRLIVILCCAALVLPAAAVTAQQMKGPKMETLNGTLIDVTCASKAKGMMNSWANTKNDHMMPDGKIQKGCAQLCLQTGQPAALFDGKKISAVFGCSASHTLADFAGKEVAVQGFKATGNIFIPAKIKSGSGSWQEVQCSEMHS